MTRRFNLNRSLDLSGVSGMGLEVRANGSTIAEDVLVELRGWIRSRTERTRAREGGL